jgi:hypothetical protein
MHVRAGGRQHKGAVDGSIGRTTGEEGEVRRTGTVGRPKAISGQACSRQAGEGGLPRALEPLIVLDLPTGDEMGVCQEIVDVPVHSLDVALVAAEAGAQAAWSKGTAGIGVPALRKGPHAQFAHPDVSLRWQIEEQKVGSRAEQRITVATTMAWSSGRRLSTEAAPVAGVGGSGDRSSLRESKARR